MAPAAKISLNGYTELRSIGRGSFGEAVLVQDKDGHCFVMKTVDIGSLDKEQQKDAVNEVQVLSSLKHPYIVRYHESFIDEGTLAIVMDYAEGGDLAKRIKDHSRLHKFFDEPQIVRWFTQSALALKYLHKRNIIHRDIKPQNMFLTKADDLRIGDFGISKELGNKRAVVEQTIGTPYYLSPEICTRRLYSFASDMWALGCVVFELTALHVPFEAQHITSLIKKITSGIVPVVPQAYSSELRQLVSSLLCQDHKRRPSAADVVQGTIIQAEMRKMLGGLPTTNTVASPRVSSSLPTQCPSTPRLVGATSRPQSTQRPQSAPRSHPSPRSSSIASAAQRPQRTSSPRNMLRQSGNNLMSTPKLGMKELLSRPPSACGNKARDDIFNRKPNCPRPPAPAQVRPASSGRPRSAAPLSQQRRSYALAGG